MKNVKEYFRGWYKFLTHKHNYAIVEWDDMVDRKIKRVIIGIGEPLKDIGGFASSLLDGRAIEYSDGSKEVFENQSIIQEKIRKALRYGKV